MFSETFAKVRINFREMFKELFGEKGEADLNLIDLKNLALGKPKVHHDLPAGGARILQSSSGYVGTFVAGVQTRDHDQDTGERPGRLIRRQMFG